MRFPGLLFLTTAFLAILPVARAAPGDLDPLTAEVFGAGFGGGRVHATALQPDGKIVIVGGFDQVLGAPRGNVARLHADGTLDLGFDPKANAEVYCVAVQPDGKLLLGGSFTALQPNGAAGETARHYVARVHADGTLDDGFDPRASMTVTNVVLQADGKVLIGGGFETLQPNGDPAPTARVGIARVNSDGTLDTGFDPRADWLVETVAVQPDGKVLLGGHFTWLQPNGAAVSTARRGIARVHADGTLDTGFNPTANGDVYSVTVQADGKVLIAGNFTTLRPNGAAAATTRRYIARVHADGTLDTGFDPSANNLVYTVTLQADGKILTGGEFTAFQPNGAESPATRSHIARINAGGTLDAGFEPGADLAVNGVMVQPDGRVLLGGFFTALQPNNATVPTARHHIARLLNDSAAQTLTVPDATQILWQRGGAAPELSQVTFELSTDGGTSWTPFKAVTRTRTTANWQRTRLSLPPSGLIRARGVTTGGYLNGSSGLIEQTVSFPPFTPDADNDGLPDSWEVSHFGSTGHSAADDFDRDGYNELLELAFGLDPTVSNSGGLPAVTNEGGCLTMTITKQPGAAYEVQSAGTLLPALPDSFSAASTTVLINDATALKVRDNSLIDTAPGRFMRVKVTAAP